MTGSEAGSESVSFFGQTRYNSVGTHFGNERLLNVPLPNCRKWEENQNELITYPPTTSFTNY